MLLASDRPELKIKMLLKGAFGIPDGGATPLKDGCAHKLLLMGRLTVSTTSGLLTGRYQAAIGRCTECKGYVIGSEAHVAEALKAHPASEEGVRE